MRFKFRAIHAKIDGILIYLITHGLLFFFSFSLICMYILLIYNWIWDVFKSLLVSNILNTVCLIMSINVSHCTWCCV